MPERRAWSSGCSGDRWASLRRLGLVVYFLLAIGAHIRANDAVHLPTPVVIELMAVAALVLRAGSLS